MSETTNEGLVSVVLGQKYAYATISLILGIACFINLVGLEKAILAVIFGWMALKPMPAPKLTSRRVWAQTGVTLGIIMMLVVPTIILLNLERLRVFIDALATMSNGK